MALQWSFNEDYCGYLKFPQALEDDGGTLHIVRLYRGNALLIAIYEEYPGEGEYQLCNFFADKTHALNMFGKKKGFKYEGFPFSLCMREENKVEYVNPVRIHLDPGKFTAAEIGWLTQLFIDCPDPVPVEWCKPVRLHELD